jgi:hypothetical protein
MAKEKMMPYMTGYSNSYIPPKGNAGSAAFGEYAHKKNPLKVPEKGSMIGESSNFGSNADRNKVQAMVKSEAKKESLRGMGC